MNEITNRRTTCSIAGFLSAVAIASWSFTPLRADGARPNFVIIFTDDQGYQDVGCFGSPDIRTPRLDEMAKQGMKFTSFYAQPVCGPSRAALITGCYPMRVAERGHTKQVHPILHEDEITVAEVLQTKGYTTACFGKWDLAKHALLTTFGAEQPPNVLLMFAGDLGYGDLSCFDGGHVSTLRIDQKECATEPFFLS